MRALTLGLVAALLIEASPAAACAPYRYSPMAAEGRFRDQSGQWRPVRILADNRKLRFDIPDSRAPWGKLVIIGNLEYGTAAVFAIDGARRVPKSAQMIWSTSLYDAFADVGLPESMIARFPHHQSQPRKFGAFTCQGAYPDGDAGRPDETVCAISNISDGSYGGQIPAYVTNASGDRIFELQEKSRGPIAPSEFEAPRFYKTVKQKPQYLRGYGCQRSDLMRP